MTQSQNWLDRVVTAVSPQRGAKRLEARARISRLTQTKALYDAASLSRRTQGWRAIGTDANAETRIAMGRLRDVSRDMERNNPFAARAKTTIAHNVVGTGILVGVNAARPERKKKVQSLIDGHFDSTDIDADGRLNLNGLQNLVMTTVVVSGECLVRKRPRRSEDGYGLPFQLQVLEPDFIDTGIDGKLPNGNYAVQGVEFDLRGKRVAYYLFDQHPGGIYIGGSGRTASQRVSADFIAHVYRVDRPGQVRGVTWFAPVIVRMRDFADYTDAQLLRQKIAACFAAFITTTEDASASGKVDGTGDGVSAYPVENIEPGMIERLREGETVSFATPPATADFAAYANTTLHEIAAGLNIPFEAFTGDLSGVNYSSGRMGWLEYQRSIESWRWNMLIPQFLGPLGRWTQEAVNVVTGSTEPFHLSYTPPRREMIDPSVEIDSANKAIRSGLSWRSEELRRLGYSPEEVYAGIAEDNRIADENGFVFDSDPRRVNNRGAAQKPATGKPTPDRDEPDDEDAEE